MIKLNYVDYDLAYELYLNKFQGLCNAYYENGCDDDLYADDGWFMQSDSDKIIAPEIELVSSWFRIKHKIHIEIYSNHSGWGWILTKLNGTTIKEIEDDNFFNNYDTALISGIYQALKLL